MTYARLERERPQETALERQRTRKEPADANVISSKDDSYLHSIEQIKGVTVTLDFVRRARRAKKLKFWYIH